MVFFFVVVFSSDSAQGFSSNGFSVCLCGCICVLQAVCMHISACACVHVQDKVIELFDKVSFCWMLVKTVKLTYDCLHLTRLKLWNSFVIILC